VQRIVVADPLAEQQSSNAVRVPNALPQQRGALAPAVVFPRADLPFPGSLPEFQRLFPDEHPVS
jgi:hypothetical protein